MSGGREGGEGGGKVAGEMEEREGVRRIWKSQLQGLCGVWVSGGAARGVGRRWDIRRGGRGGVAGDNGGAGGAGWQGMQVLW